MTPETRLAVITTHPIQYIAPWYRALAQEPSLSLDVIFMREPEPHLQGQGFGQAFRWDIPLRDGYRSVVLGVSEDWRHLPAALSGLRRELRRLAPDVVMVTGWNEPALALSYPMLKALGLPIVVRGEANAIRPRPRWTAPLHSSLLRMASSAVVIGKSNREFYLRAGMAPERLMPGCYFVETERLLPMAAAHEKDRPAVRAAMGCTNDDVVFAFSGKHVPFKNPLMLIEAAGQLRKEGLNVRLVFAGSGELTEQMRALAEELDVPAHFTGFLNQTEIWKAYVGADAFVLPSNNGETWGLVVNEAMLFGLPAIVSDQVGCSRDLIVPGETGYTFTGGADALAAAMRTMAAQGSRRQAMGARARQLVTERYSMPVATAGLLAAIDTARRGPDVASGSAACASST